MPERSLLATGPAEQGFAAERIAAAEVIDHRPAIARHGLCDAWLWDLRIELAVSFPHSQLSEERIPGGIERRPVPDRLNRSLENPPRAVAFCYDFGIPLEHLLFGHGGMPVHNATGAVVVPRAI
jgi:hypothetical protein